jgi:ribonuclease P protein component
MGARSWQDAGQGGARSWCQRCLTNEGGLLTRKRSFPFPKEMHLQRRSDFDRVFEQGTRVALRNLVVVLAPSSAGISRLGVSCSRQVGDAVVRNRMKRLVRESFRLLAPNIQSPCDMVVVVRRFRLNRKGRFLDGREGTKSEPRFLPGFKDILGDMEMALRRIGLIGQGS